MKRGLTLVLVATAVVFWLGDSPNAVVRFADNFEYVVSRSDPNAQNLFLQRGWSNAKSEQTDGGANGFLYTTTSIPGFTGAFPGTNSSRVLAIEALPGSLGNQTDFYLELGGATNYIPGDVWFQFWMYPQDSGSQRSRYGTRNKFMYMCNGPYPCHNHLWMVGQGALTYNPNNHAPLGDPSNGEFFFNLSSASGVSTINNSQNPDSPGTLGSNTNEWMRRNRWTLVKMRMRTTSTSGNSWEVWLRPYGASWVKVSEWIPGTTPGFTWGVPSASVGGHRTMRMPTTVGAPSAQWYDYWLYMDDFTMATTEQDLPLYPDDPSGMSAPRNLRIIGGAMASLEDGLFQAPVEFLKRRFPSLMGVDVKAN